MKAVEHIKSLQEMQREMSNNIATLGDMIKDLKRDISVLEADLKAEIRDAKSEAKLEAIQQATSVVTNVQNGFNQRMQDIAVQVAMLDQANHRQNSGVENPALIAKPADNSDADRS